MSEDHLSKRVAFLQPDEFSVERVFPIRNLVATGPTGPTEPSPVRQDDDSLDFVPSAQGPSLAGGVEDPLPRETLTDISSGAAIKHQHENSQLPGSYLPPPWPAVPPKTSLRSIPESQLSSDDHGTGQTTERARLIPTTSGPPGISPGLICGNTTRRYYRCEDEPIHTPGAIQQFGALVALRYNEQNDLEVRIASENSLGLLERTPHQLFELKTFVDIFDPSSREDVVSRIQDAIKKVTKSEERDSAMQTQLEIIHTIITTPHGLQKQLWCAIHVSFGTQDLVVCEFEEYSPKFYLGDMYLKSTLPEHPVSTVDMELDPEEQRKSFTRQNRPLRVLEIARRRKNNDVPSMDVFGAMTDAQSQLANCKSVQEILEVIVGIVSELTGFHRVMFYRFDSMNNGCVDAEYVDPKASEDLFRGKSPLLQDKVITNLNIGLHYPASDIPPQARKLYELNRIRILYDRDAETARLVCRDIADFTAPLDLSHAYLRAISPIHLKYLANMGVRSSMSISVLIHGKLWGLIACHGYGDIGIRVTPPIRELCRNLGECAATNIERLIMWERINKRKAPREAPPTQNPAGFIAASSADLLQVFGADFGLLSIQDEARTIGKLEPYREALAILAHLQQHRFTSIFSSQNVNKDFPNINYPPGIHTISGCLIIPLSINGGDFLVFFRKGQLQEIRWAGNPYEKIKKTGSEYLEPRMSFARWTEEIIGTSAEWSEDQIETASVLSLLYGRFIEIWRQKESAGQNNKMTRLLLQNSSHEVRTPLNAIVNYLEIALENHLDKNTREVLTKAHKASKSLIYVIDDLLNLTKAEDLPLAAPGEVFDLGATVSEVIAAFRKEAIRKGLDLTVSTHQGIPEMVKGDSARLRQVLSNVTSNAFQHSLAGGIKVDIRPISNQNEISVIGITVQDAGVGMSESQLDDLFQEFEQVFDEEGHLSSHSTTPVTNDETGQLGVGLAVVARYVRNMKGQIRIQSEPGKGTIFGIELPFENVPTTPDGRIPYSPSEAMPKAMSDATLTPITAPRTPLQDGGGLEITGIFNSNESLRSGLLGEHYLSTSASSTVEPFNPGYPFPRISSLPSNLHRQSLSVLIAEDNPINSRLLARRLQKLGHIVEVTYDGQECHDHFRHVPEAVDVILMDIQMPLISGTDCTRMIRTYERNDESVRRARQRVPIIAVSASLMEEDRFDYISYGFDGWILKPIDFQRLDFLLQGINAPGLKREALYQPGRWEQGGWFLL